MTRKHLNITDEIYDYLLSASLDETDIERELRDLTAKHKLAMMQVAPEQAQFMGLLIKMLNARRVIEIGVFTGYSSLRMARALPADGIIIACDISEEYTNIAREFWEKAGVTGKIQLEIAPATETLDQLITSGDQASYDFIFIDADKAEYQDYYERALILLRTGGVIMVDNVLWYGKPADSKENDKDTRSIREFNRLLKHDKRVSISMLPIADGITLAVKR